MAHEAVIADLEGKRKDLEERIGALTLQLEELRKMQRAYTDAIAKLSDAQEVLNISEGLPHHTVRLSDREMSIHETVKQIFDLNPADKFTPPEIKQLLLDRRDRGLLTSKADDLIYPAHNAIGDLKREGFIKAVGKKGQSKTYRRAV
jgi:hypothetical protein